jgi:hypothetical protein
LATIISSPSSRDGVRIGAALRLINPLSSGVERTVVAEPRLPETPTFGWNVVNNSGEHNPAGQQKRTGGIIGANGDGVQLAVTFASAASAAAGVLLRPGRHGFDRLETHCGVQRSRYWRTFQISC